MIWITKYTHNKIVEVYKENIKTLQENINRKEAFEDICERLTTVVEKIHPNSFMDISGGGGWTTACGIDVMAKLDDTVPVYVDDYFGGKVIKQEATPVTILDENGKATYGLTAKKPTKGKSYLLVEA